MAPKRAKKRRICFVITSFIHYSRNLLILEELKKRADVELHIIIGGTALLSKYSSKTAHIEELLKREGFTNIHELHFNLEGDNYIVKAKTAGLGVIEFAGFFNDIQPDLVVVRGDRFEVLAAAIAASYMHIPIAHIEGGDTTGSIDESVRHAVTKLSHIHFATNDAAKKRLVRMGESPEYVFNFGSPDVEVVSKLGKRPIAVDIATTGSGAMIDLGKPYLMVMYHPDTGVAHDAAKHAKLLLSAIHRLGIPTLWFWPNFDAGAEDISHELRVFRDQVKDHKIRFLRYIPPREFISLLTGAVALVGNSSAGLKESSFLGLPVVNIGDRQGSRLHAENVMHVPHNEKAIVAAILEQAKVGRYPVSHLYFAKDTARNIAKTLSTAPLYIQKRFVD